MKPADFALLCVVCLIMGGNMVISRWALADLQIPPIAFAAIRFSLMALVLFPFLRPIPEKFGLIVLISLGVGAVHFTLLFYGLARAEAGAASITTQLGAPFATILSVIFLGEEVRWRRWIGIALSLIGVGMMAIDPATFTISIGLVFVAAAAFFYACSMILMKQAPRLSPLRMQAWVGAISSLPLIATSGLMETGQIAAFQAGGWEFVAVLVYAVAAVSIFGHGAFYHMVQRYNIGLISPLMLMGPVWGDILSVVFLGERLNWMMGVGAVIALAGMAVISMRSNTKAPLARIGRRPL